MPKTPKLNQVFHTRPPPVDGGARDLSPDEMKVGDQVSVFIGQNADESDSGKVTAVSGDRIKISSYDEDYDLDYVRDGEHAGMYEMFGEAGEGFQLVRVTTHDDGKSRPMA